MSDSRPVILICESGLRWTAAWRRGDAQVKARLETVNSLAACEERLRSAPASFLVLEASLGGMPVLLEWLTLQFIERQELAVAIVGDTSLNEWRYGLMERDAILVATSERQLPAVCTAAQRHVSSWQPRELSMRERTLNSLPWSDTSP
ncbi:MAG: hypothetical protein SGJ19_17360 [Planctomycetia bacterium]|nr:hypothetical protein [Planctomycetia bacterium]